MVRSRKKESCSNDGSSNREIWEVASAQCIFLMIMRIRRKFGRWMRGIGSIDKSILH